MQAVLRNFWFQDTKEQYHHLFILPSLINDHIEIEIEHLMWQQWLKKQLLLKVKSLIKTKTKVFW